MTIKQVKAAIKATGCKVVWSKDWQEWQVIPPNSSKSSAYYTDDAQDAIDTAKAMTR